MSYLPCGTYFESYLDEQSWWRTPLIKGKMALMVILLVALPFVVGGEWVSVASNISYYVLAALGVQLLIGYCGQITLGHAAFVAVGAYCSAMMVLFVPWPEFVKTAGLAYPVSIICSGIVAGLWSVLFGLPSAKVKGFYLIMTTMAAQFITVDFVITQYVSQIGGRGVALSIPPGTIKVGPWVIDNDLKVYYLMVFLVVVCTLGVSNLMRTKIGRAWIAIRDNDIAAETMGVNIVAYKLMAFFVAGVLGGIAGAFWVSSLSALSPEHFTWGWSLWIVGVILIGGVGSTHGTIFGALFMTLILEGLKFAVIPLSEDFPQLQEKFLFIKESAFGLAICLFLLFEPKGLAYRWWQIKNYFNLWPFSY